MKVLLNLLPEERRIVIRRKYYGRFFFWQAVKLLVIEAFYVVLLVSVFYILYENRTSVERAESLRADSTAETKELELYERKFLEVNEMAAQSARFDSEHLSWAEFLRIMDRTVPENIMITSLATKDYQVFLSGIAVSRDNFLELEKKLKEEECFSDVKAPVSNLFSVKNVEFQVDFFIKKECIKGK